MVILQHENLPGWQKNGLPLACISVRRHSPVTGNQVHISSAKMPLNQLFVFHVGTPPLPLFVALNTAFSTVSNFQSNTCIPVITTRSVRASDRSESACDRGTSRNIGFSLLDDSNHGRVSLLE